MNWKTGMHLFLGISIEGGRGYMYRLSVPVYGEQGDVYDLYIESKINLAGNVIIKIKIYVIDY